MRRLTYYAPRRAYDPATKSTHSWTLREVLLYIFEAGGWFMPGAHDFDSGATERIAVNSDTYKEVEYAKRT